MALTQERLGQIALDILIRKLTEEGFHLKPKEVKREASNAAKKAGIPAAEMAEVYKKLLEALVTKTMSELDSIINATTVEEKSS